MTEGSVEEGRNTDGMEGGQVTDGGVEVRNENSEAGTGDRGTCRAFGGRNSGAEQHGGYSWSPGIRRMQAMSGRVEGLCLFVGG